MSFYHIYQTQLYYFRNQILTEENVVLSQSSGHSHLDEDSFNVAKDFDFKFTIVQRNEYGRKNKIQQNVTLSKKLRDSVSLKSYFHYVQCLFAKHCSPVILQLVSSFQTCSKFGYE